MAGPRPTPTLTDERLRALAYLADEFGPYESARLPRSYGNALAQLSGGFVKRWSDRGWGITQKGMETVEWLRAVRRIAADS